MSSNKRAVAILSIIVGLVLALALNACGSSSVSSSSLPSSAVANVDGHLISVEQTKRLMLDSVRQLEGPSGTLSTPPEYTSCVAFTRKREPKKNAAEAKKECVGLYSSLRQQVLQFLVGSVWIEIAGKENGISVSESEVQKEFAKYRQTALKTEAELKSYLAKTGLTLGDVLERVKTNLISQKLEKKLAAGTPKATEAEAQAYYKTHPSPTQNWNFLAALVKPADANKAKQELASGVSFATVAQKYTASPGSQNGTEVKEEVLSQLNPTLGKAIEKAKVGELVGPVQDKAGDYFFRITKTKKLPATTFTEIKKSVIAAVQHEHETNAVKNFNKQQGLKYRKITLCASAWYYAPACGREK